MKQTPRKTTPNFTEVDVAREENVQRPLYFTLPAGEGEPSGGAPARSGSISRIPITLTRERSPPPGDASLQNGDVTYADPLDFQHGWFKLKDFIRLVRLF